MGTGQINSNKIKHNSLSLIGQVNHNKLNNAILPIHFECSSQVTENRITDSLCNYKPFSY